MPLLTHQLFPFKSTVVAYRVKNILWVDLTVHPLDAEIFSRISGNFDLIVALEKKSGDHQKSVELILWGTWMCGGQNPQSCSAQEIFPCCKNLRHSGLSLSLGFPRWSTIIDNRHKHVVITWGFLGVVVFILFSWYHFEQPAFKLPTYSLPLSLAQPSCSLAPLQSCRIILSHTRPIIIRPCTEFHDNTYSLFSVLIPYQMHRSHGALTDLGRLSGEQW